MSDELSHDDTGSDKLKGDALDGSSFYDGGCGCGGVEGGSLGEVGAGIWDTYTQLPSFLDDPLVIGSDAIIVTIILLSMLILFFYLFTDINMMAYTISIAVVGGLAVATRFLAAIWKGRPGRNLRQ